MIVAAAIHRFTTVANRGRFGRCHLHHRCTRTHATSCCRNSKSRALKNSKYPLTARGSGDSTSPESANRMSNVGFGTPPSACNALLTMVKLSHAVRRAIRAVVSSASLSLRGALATQRCFGTMAGAYVRINAHNARPSVNALPRLFTSTRCTAHAAFAHANSRASMAHCGDSTIDAPRRAAESRSTRLTSGARPPRRTISASNDLGSNKPGAE